MKRELFIHFSFWTSVFILLTLLKRMFNLDFWPFWVGGLIGVVLPDIDHIIYFYFLSPTDLTSQRFGYMIEKKEFWRSIELLYETRTERKGLIFHTIFFQLIFFVLMFLIMTSSGSIFGKGLVLSFMIHLLVDQMIDITEIKNFDNWFKYLPIRFDFDKAKIYWIVASVLTLGMGVLM